MSNILNYFIIGLIFFVVIALLLQLSGCSNGNNDEHMEKTEQELDENQEVLNQEVLNQEELDLFYAMNKNMPNSKQKHKNDFFGLQNTISYANITETDDTEKRLIRKETCRKLSEIAEYNKKHNISGGISFN